MAETAPQSLSAQLRGFAWFVASFFAFLIGTLCFSTAAMEHIPMWLCADRYQPAELEVTRLAGHPKSRGGRTIEGVIHPGGERVTASTHKLSIRRFVDPSDTTGRLAPRPDEVEGRRIEVLYWPRHADEIRGWHPPTVLMPGSNQNTGRAVVRCLLLGGALYAGMVFCFRRGWRYVKASNPEAFRPTDTPGTPTWFGVVLVLVYVGVLGLVAYLS